ncbi:MAG: response regulator [Opitutaceae bacterium]
MTRTLLIIDDNKSVRESLRFLIMRRGYTVFVAENGTEGIALAAKVRVDGALIDVNMPGMNGIEVCRALREQAAESGRQIAIWIMTGARTPQVTRQAADAGALNVFGKPFDFADLFRRFEEQWGKHEPPATPPMELDLL